ncbi:MMPL family transporter [Kineosporia rhizophila]|uniref:MMPL family transporter n=1 Tax=Kineosporia rhizophila TaxID=84633 RepID=UPI001E3A61C6|nr:MMPL family transporter [Kineosporia rhizophila]
MARLLYRLGVFCARRRPLVFAIWLLAAVGLGVGAATGNQFSDGGFSMPGSESSRALDRMETHFPAAQESEDTGSLQLTLTNRTDSPIGVGANRRAVEQILEQAAGLPNVAAVSDPFDRQMPYVSPDKSTAVATISLTGVTDDNAEALHEQVVDLAEQAQGLDVEVGGSLGAGGAGEGGHASELVGIALSFVVLLVTYGSLVAAGANILMALVGVAVGLLGVLAFSALQPISSTTPTLALMIGLAVGIDYCLFILARTRNELREGRSLEDAIGRAAGTAGSAVVFAGTTVIIALAALSVVGIGFLTEMGLAAAFTVLVAVLAALTLLPALSRSMGPRMMPRKERHGRQTRNADRLTFLERWISIVVRRPAVVAVSVIAALLVLCIPVLSMQTALSTPGGEDPDSTQRAAYDLIAEKFGAGAQDPLIVLLEGEDVQAQVGPVTSTIQSLPDVARVTPAGVSEAGDAAILQITPASGPIDESTYQLVRDIRSAASDLDGVQLSVTGQTAIDIDLNHALNQALIVYLILVVGLSLLLLIVLFRSILVPVIATLGFLLSVGSAFGVTVAVFQWGWLSGLFAAPSGNPLLTFMPILIVGILFGLAMDYQVFLVSRIHEAHRHGMRPVEAILDGFGRTAIVVAAAALIMTSVFGAFAIAPMSIIASIGLALTAGVLVDAFVVRMILVPALLALLGETAWWMPRWLDRVLPHIDAEGESLETDERRVPVSTAY